MLDMTKWKPACCGWGLNPHRSCLIMFSQIFFFSWWVWNDWSVFLSSPLPTQVLPLAPVMVPTGFYLWRKNSIGLFWVRQKRTALTYLLFSTEAPLVHQLAQWMYYKDWILVFQNVGMAIFPVATKGTAAKNPVRSKKHFSRRLQYKNKWIINELTGDFQPETLFLKSLSIAYV